MKQLRISRHGKVRGSALDNDDDDIDHEFKLTPAEDQDVSSPVTLGFSHSTFTV